MKQTVNIRKVSVDCELKVSVLIEFIAGDQESRGNVFRLIEMQGDIAEVSVEPAQQELPVGEGELVAA